MHSWLNSFRFIVVVSIVLILGLAGLMLWKENVQRSEPLVVYCAAALKEPMEALVPIYEEQKGVRIELRFGKSEEGLAGIKMTKQGDVYLPADESFIAKAQDEGLLGDVLPLAKMNAVLAVSPKSNRSFASWEDLFKDENVKLAIASEGAAVRELIMKHLSDAKGRQLVDRSIALGTVTEVANAIKQGTVDAGIIWDNMVASPNYSMLKIVKLKELKGITATVKIGVVKNSPRYNEALAFAQYVSGSCADIFQSHGFTSISNLSAKPPKKAQD